MGSDTSQKPAPFNGYSDEDFFYPEGGSSVFL
jgi:hypothetical protein